MTFDQELKNSLSDVPEIPAGLFGKIESRIVSKKRRLSLFYAIAATLLLFLGSLTFFVNKKPINKMENEVADELQILHDYVNGNDLDSDLEMYAIISNY
jgi:hypothetical protein